MTGTFHGSSTVAGQANLPAGEFAGEVGSNTSTQTLVSRQQHLTPHSNGIDSGNTASGLGTIPMMTDERRMYRIFSKTNLSRFSTDVFKLIDLPTRIDMRDVIVSVIRPRSVTQTSDPEEDKLDRADIMVFGQLADFNGCMTSPRVMLFASTTPRTHQHDLRCRSPREMPMSQETVATWNDHRRHDALPDALVPNGPASTKLSAGAQLQNVLPKCAWTGRRFWTDSSCPTALWQPLAPRPVPSRSRSTTTERPASRLATEWW